MKKTIKITALIIALFSVMNITAFANAGPSSWNGTNATSVMAKDSDCPIVVENELLTFNINQLPQEYYSENEQAELESYSADFTASYTFYNPTDYEITATLAFPFGIMPEYISSSANIYPMIEKYNVAVNDRPVEKQIRYTNMESYNKFDYYIELPKLTDQYMKDDFYSPDMSVTKYIISATVEDTEENKLADLRFIWDGEENPDTRIITEGFGGYRWMEGKKAELSATIRNNEHIIIYVIGQPLKETPQFTFYESFDEDAEQIKGSVQIKTEETTLLELFKQYSESWDMGYTISDTDIYNICLTNLERSRQDYYNSIGIVNFYYYMFDSFNIMGWYVYDITLAPDERLINTVSAPLYPGIAMNYEPNKFQYTYLLSPAKGWAEFGDIEININTPYYILENSIEGFEKTDSGYVYKGNGLPEGELEFVLSESENPKKEIQWEYSIFLLIPLAIIAVLVVFFVLLIKHGEKKYKEQQRQANNEKDD